MCLKRDNDVDCEDREHNTGLDVVSKRLKRPSVDFFDVHSKDALKTVMVRYYSST